MPKEDHLSTTTTTTSSSPQWIMTKPTNEESQSTKCDNIKRGKRRAEYYLEDTRILKKQRKTPSIDINNLIKNIKEEKEELLSQPGFDFKNEHDFLSNIQQQQQQQQQRPTLSLLSSLINENQENRSISPPVFRFDSINENTTSQPSSPLFFNHPPPTTTPLSTRNSSNVSSSLLLNNHQLNESNQIEPAYQVRDDSQAFSPFIKHLFMIKRKGKRVPSKYYVDERKDMLPELREKAYTILNENDGFYYLSNDQWKSKEQKLIQKFAENIEEMHLLMNEDFENLSLTADNSGDGGANDNDDKTTITGKVYFINIKIPLNCNDREEQ